MGYVLESKSESKRLQNQSLQKEYSIKNELEYLDQLKQYSTILDLGCGTGVLTREIKQLYPSSEVEGCDFSDLRIHEAKRLDPNKSINFFNQDLMKMNFDQKYDLIVSRYVFEHLLDPQLVMDNAYRACKDSGRVYIIDFDGIFLNVFTTDDYFNNQLEKLKKSFEFDLYVGRKLPSFMEKSGFKNIKWSAELVQFSGAELEEEIQNCKARCENAKPVIQKILGEEADCFIDLYPKYLEKQSTVLFYNKFIVSAERL